MKVFLKTALVSGLVFAVDRTLLTPLGPSRLLLDLVLYVVSVLAIGAVAVRETVDFARSLRRTRSPLV